MNYRESKLKEISILKSKKEVAKVIKTLRTNNNSTVMEAFYKRAEDIYLNDKLDFKDKLVIGTLCVHVPIEIIYALGAVPIRLCNGFTPMEQLGSELLPVKVCPMVKAIAGSLYVKAFNIKPEPSLIINPTTCDQKKKLAEALPFDSIDFYNLEMPSNKESEAAQNYWKHSLSDLIIYLEKFTKKRLKKENLKEAMIKVSTAQKLYRELNNYRKIELISGPDMMLISSLYFIDDIDIWINNITNIIEELKASENKTSNGNPKILMTGSPSIFPQLKIPNMLVEHGASLVADEFCSSNRLLYDSAAVAEWQLHDMIPALADKYLKPNTCPVFVPNDSRVRKIKQLCEQNDIEGIVYQNFSGCQPYDMESNMINKLANDMGIPFLMLETSYVSDDKGQLSTRIEAFIDSIKMNL